MKSRFAWLLAVAVAAACTSPPAYDWDANLPEGSCVVFRFNTPEGAEREMQAVDCSEPHTHVVSARVPEGENCPPGTDVEQMIPGQRYMWWCYRAVDEATPNP